MQIGKVKWFSNTKGYGFICSSQGDVFVHYSVIQMNGYRSLMEGQDVQYVLEQGTKGLQASAVIPMEATA